MFFQGPDATQQLISLPTLPQRIVSLVPSQTELLFALGLKHQLVGRTKFCIHPQEVQHVPIVGGTKDFKLDKIRALKPDLVLANLEENTPEVQALRPDIPVFTTGVAHLAQALSMIRQVGHLTARAETAEQLANQIEAAFQPLKPPVTARRCLYLIWRNPWMTVGGDTFISDMLSYAGFTNLCAVQQRYPSLTNQQLQTLEPDWVLLSSEPYPFKEKHLEELQTLCPQAQVQLVDGELFSWYGSRLLLAAPYLKQLRHSEQHTPDGSSCDG